MSNMNETVFEAPSQFKAWTAIDDSTLRELVEAGHNSAEIAEALGRSRAAIACRKSHLGIDKRMTPARGTLMPYTSKSYKPVSKSEGFQISAPVVDKESKVATIVTPPQPVPSIGHTVDTLVEQAKRHGIQLSITISTEDKNVLN